MDSYDCSNWLPKSTAKPRTLHSELTKRKPEELGSRTTSYNQRLKNERNENNRNVILFCIQVQSTFALVMSHFSASVEL
jgi:hypothetical protein